MPKTDEYSEKYVCSVLGRQIGGGALVFFVFLERESNLVTCL